jgi:hypothetical protein
VTACVSNHCRRLFQDGDNRYGAAGNAFNLVLRAGQRRTVEITATNTNHHSQWGPQTVTVR